jgi:hypothetical protein
MVTQATTSLRYLVCLGTVLTMVALGVAACNSSSDDRVSIPSSDPPIACSPAAGARASKDAQAAIAHAKAVWAAIHEKNPTNEMVTPAYLALFEPYSAKLKDGVWHVEGTIPPGFHGYVPLMSVCRNDEGASAGSIKIP